MSAKQQLYRANPDRLEPILKEQMTYNWLADQIEEKYPDGATFKDVMTIVRTKLSSRQMDRAEISQLANNAIRDGFLFKS